MTTETIGAAQTGPTRGLMRPVPETELSLLVDVGSAWTKAALVGRAGGRWRIVSGTAQPSSWGESVLVEDLVSRLAPHADARLSRRLVLLVRDAPRITCRSPRRPGRLVVVADTLIDQGAASSVAIRNGWTVVGAVAGDDRRPDAERYASIRDLEPDAWLAVASSGAPPPPASPLWGMLAAARGPQGAPLVVVGAEEVQVPFAQLFGPGTQWVGPVVSDALAEPMLALLADANGSGEVQALAPIAFGRSMAALGRGLGLEVLGVDLGATWLAWGATARGGGTTAVLADTGDRSLPEGSRAATEVLPTDVDEFTTTDALANLAARPAAVPSSASEAAIAQALGIDRLAAARRWMGGCPPVDLLVGGGRLLAAAAHPADAALALLDGLRPVGLTQLALDPWGICGPLGTLPGDDFDEGMETLRDDLLVPLGTAVVSRGGRPGQVAFRARLHRPGWPDSTRVEVRSGGLVVLPLERGAAGELEVELERGVDLGVAPRARRVRAAVTGGAVGVILDARDDPMQLPARPGDARTTIQSWRDALRREGRTAPG
ncbi:MAG: hypothetical protein ACRDFZ_08405 [Candidatus Limnocylindria bacterium]